MQASQIRLKDKIKVVTIKSTKSVKNSTNIEIELGLVPKQTNKIREIVRVLPGEEYFLSIESAYNDAIFVRPFNFGYNWSMQSVYWKELTATKRVSSFTAYTHPFIQRNNNFSEKIEVNLPFFNGQSTN